MKDPFVEEVRAFRMEHTRQYSSDLHLICADLKRFESSLGDRVITLQPRKILPPNALGTKLPRVRQ